MDKKEEFIQKVELLEKEVWALVKKTLPQFKADILSQLGGQKFEQLEKALEEVKKALEGMSADIVSNTAQIDKLNEKQQKNIEDIQSLQTQASTLQTVLEEVQENTNSLSGAVDDCKNEIAEIKQKDTQQDATIDNLNKSVIYNGTQIEQTKTSVLNMQEGVSDLQNDMQSANENLTALDKKVADAQDELLAIKDKDTQQDKTISNMNITVLYNGSQIEKLQARIEELEKRPSGGGGRTVETVYDMNSADASINKGFTSGIIGNNTITWTEEYTHLRIYASLGGVFAYQEIPVENRMRNDVVLRGVATTGKVVHNYRLLVYADDKKINTGKSFTYTIATSGTVTVDNKYQETYYITRIEGIKGQ